MPNFIKIGDCDPRRWRHMSLLNVYQESRSIKIESCPTQIILVITDGTLIMKCILRIPQAYLLSLFPLARPVVTILIACINENFVSSFSAIYT